MHGVPSSGVPTAFCACGTPCERVIVGGCTHSMHKEKELAKGWESHCRAEPSPACRPGLHRYSTSNLLGSLRRLGATGLSSASSHAASPGAHRQAELGAPSSRQPDGSVGDAGRENKHFPWDREQNGVGRNV